MNLSKVVKAVQEVGVINEEIPIKALTLICCGKLVRNKETTSTNMHPEDASRCGKDHLVGKVKEIVFYKDWIKFSNPTPTAISYTQRSVDKGTKEAPNWVTEGEKITKDKIVYIKDASEDFLNGDDFKLLLEDDNVNMKKTIKNASVSLRWEKPIVIITTADTTTGNQIIGRLPSLSLDSSERQTELINDHQLDKCCDISHKIKDYELIEEAKRFFYTLKEFDVDLSKEKDKIKDRVPQCTEVIMRSLFPRLLDYIKFSAAFHQNDREIRGQILYANEEDLDVGFEIFEYIYKEEYTDVSTLNKRQRKIREFLINHKGTEYSISEINNLKESKGVSEQQTREDMRTLVGTGIKFIEGRPQKYCGGL